MENSILFITSATFLTAALVYYHLKKFSFWSSRNIKGPLPWPLLGTNVYALFRHRSVVDAEWRQKYGKIYGVYNGYTPVLRVADNKVIKHIFIKEFRSFTDRDNSFIYGDVVKRWLLWSSGEHWSNQRAIITPMFTSMRMKTMFATMKGCTERFLREIQSRVGSSGRDSNEAPKGGIFSRSQLMALTLDVIAQSFFSLKLDTYRDESSEFFKRAFAFATFDLKYFFLWVCIPKFVRQYFKLDLTRYYKYEYFDKLSQSTINDRRGSSPRRSNDFIQMLLDAQLSDINEQVHSKQDDLDAHYNDNTSYQELDHIHKKQLEKVSFRKFGDDEIRGHATFFFLAGFETTSAALATCLYEIAHQQQAQNEVYEELIGLPTGALSGDDGYSTLQSLKKLDAFISETLRLYAPLNELSRMVTDPEGVILPTQPPIKLPYKTAIGVPVFQLQRDPDYWRDPEKFDMSRFYPENRDQIESCTYMPFGVGPRNCVGLRFALLEVKLALAQLLLRYKVSPGPKSREYPPKFKQHFIFVQIAHNDFALETRVSSAK